MQADILKTITSATDITNAIILTHNIDFIFLQSVVLPALRKCGQPTLTVFADAGCAQQSFLSQGRLLDGLGTRYRVVPVAMQTGFRFHPKALLLSGPQKALLLVGSGNLTFGGWRENGEVWISYETGTDGTGVFSSFRSYLRDVVSLIPLAAPVRDEVEEAFDPSTREWACNLAEPEILLGKSGSGEPLLEQMKAALGSRRIEHLYVCCPYFDPDGDALQMLIRALQAQRTTVLVQSRRTTLTQDAADSLNGVCDIKAATFKHSEASCSEGQRESLLHAKFYAVDLGEQVAVFAGSANCSRAALTIPGKAGNAELLASLTLPKAQFQEEFLHELSLSETMPELLASPVPHDAPDLPEPFVGIRAARLQSGAVTVIFHAGNGVKVRSAELGGQRFELNSQGETQATIDAPYARSPLVLVADLDGAEIRSLPHWIDNEEELRTSARSRSLFDSIDRGMHGHTWSIGAWTNVLTELFKHLQYTPKTGCQPGFLSRRSKEGGNGPVEFTREDVFADSYASRFPPSLFAGQQLSREERIGSLRAMLLRWFGIARTEHSEEEDRPDGDETDPAGGDGTDDSGDMTTDRPSSLPSAAVRQAGASATPHERKHALKLVNQIAQKISDPDFLCHRDPALLGGDIKIVVVLLRAGLADKWLTSEEFLDATLKMWLPLFFNASGEERSGWIEKLYLASPEPDSFAASMCSVELSAALGCWAMSIPSQIASPQHALFELASTLSVARLPWLWQAGGTEERAKAMAELFTRTTTGNEMDWKEVERKGLTLMRRGTALNQLETALNPMGVANVLACLKWRRVAEGDLLWQGKDGFCVAKSACEQAKFKCDVLVLQQQTSKRFLGKFLIPVAGILHSTIMDSSCVAPATRGILSAMIQELREGLARVSQ